MGFIKSKAFYWIYSLLIVSVLALGVFYGVSFELICAICAALFGGVQLRMIALLQKPEDTQRKQCRPLGFFLLLPALGIIAAGARIILRPSPEMPVQMAYGSVAISIALFLCLLVQMIAFWKNGSTAGRFLRLTTAAAMSAPLSLMITRILNMTAADEAATLSCMSVVIFGVLAALIAINIGIIALCEYRNTRESIKIISDLVKSRRLVFTQATIVKDAFLVAGKTAIGVLSLSFFMFANALYSTGMGVARFIAIRMHTQSRKEQLASYRHVGIIISAASVCYVIYAARLFGGGKTETYSVNIALIIALYTFVEFGINIRDGIRLHKSKALEAKAMRAISLSSTLLCFVLTQTAIMSFAAEGDNSFTNGLAGVSFGGMAALVGLYIIIDGFLQTRTSAKNEDGEKPER